MVRVEVELRNKNRLIPWDALARPGVYLAGAYPCRAYLSAIQVKIKTIGKAIEISVGVAVSNLRQTGGKMVNLMMEINGGDAFAVIDELKREGLPNRFKSFAAQLPDMIARGEL